MWCLSSPSVSFASDTCPLKTNGRAESEKASLFKLYEPSRVDQGFPLLQIVFADDIALLSVPVEDDGILELAVDSMHFFGKAFEMI